MAKKQQLTADDILKQMYPDLKTSDDYQAEKSDDPSDPKVQIADLQKQIAELSGRLSGSQSSSTNRNRDLNDLPTPPQKPVMDYSKAPDPIQNPKEYAAWVVQGTQDEIQYQKDAWQWQQNAATSQNNRANNLWTDFRTSNEAYAKDEERIGIAAERVLNKAKAAGLNVDKYMYEDSDRFMKDVMGEFDKLFGKPNGINDDDDDDDEGDDDRSFVQGSGAPAGRDGPRDTPRAPEKFGALGTAVNAWQEKTGFIR